MRKKEANPVQEAGPEVQEEAVERVHVVFENEQTQDQRTVPGRVQHGRVQDTGKNVEVDELKGTDAVHARVRPAQRTVQNTENPYVSPQKIFA